MIEVFPLNLGFDDVAVNDIPSYRTLKIKNLESYPVSVQLESSSAFIRFQLENENCASLLKSDENKEAFSTYNEIFDSIGLVKSVSLEVGETKDLIVSFQASAIGFAHLAVQSQPNAYSSSLQLICTSLKSSTVSTDLANAPTSSTKAASNEGASTPIESESLVIPFSANVFVSFLQVSTSELQATMTANKTQLLDFTVSNLSSRPLLFVIRNQNLPFKGVELELYESEHFEDPKLGRRIMLDSFALVKLSLMARTTVAAAAISNAQFQTILQCDNLHDSRNTALIYVNINVVSELQGDLVNMPDTSINFGDVYRGDKASAELNFSILDVKEEIAVKMNTVKKCEGEVLLLKYDGTVAEEISLSANKNAKSLKFLYRPSYIPDANEESSKIQFELELIFFSKSNRQQRVVVRCFACLYTSIIAVSQTNINFGDCQVGQLKRYTFSVENQSPLPGSVIVRLRSKIISIEGVKQGTDHSVNEEFSIAPSSSLSITLRIVPQRVNPTYQKQLTIINGSNPKEDQITVNIEANNMPPSEAKLHNELYTWELNVPGGEKREDRTFDALTNVPLLIPYVVHSKVDYQLNLSVRTTSDEIELFYISDKGKSDQLDALDAEFGNLLFRRGGTSAGDIDEPTKASSYVERVEEIRKEFLKLLSEGEVFNTTFSIEPFDSIKLYAIVIRSTFTSESITKEDGLLISVESIEVPRFVRISYTLCSTNFELLGQKTKNFGEVNIGFKKITKLSLVNRCKSILYLCLSKSRSVTAGHLRIANSDKQFIFLVVRPFATKEIEVVFHPGIKGAFDEKIRIVNILDPKNMVSVTLKATVIKVDTFDVSPDSWSFGPLIIPSADDATQTTRVGAKFTVSNTSKTKRQIRLQLDAMSINPVVVDANDEENGGKSKTVLFEGVDVNVQVEAELQGAGAGSSRKIEEQIEKLTHKLKIYERKKKVEKAKKALARIEALKRALQGEEVDLTTLDNTQEPDTDASESEDDSSYMNSTKSRYQFDELSAFASEGILLPTMNAGEAITIMFGLTCRRNAEQTLPPLQTNTVNLLLFEAKDQEVNRIVPIDITVMRPEGESGNPASSPHSPTPVQPFRALVPPSLTLSPGDQQQQTVSLFMGNPLVVLRNSIVDDHTEFRFLVSSSRTTTVVVLEPRRLGCSTAYALEARFKFFPRNGLIKKDEALPIVVECTPRSVGPQKYVIPIKNLQNASEIRYLVVELNPTEEEELLTTVPKTLTFPDIITPCETSHLNSELLVIRSRFNYPHFLMVRANKPSQIRLYEDPNCTIPLKVPIERKFVKENVRVYVRFTPSPKATREEVHTIHGGIIVESVTASANEGEYCITGRALVRVAVNVGGGFLVVDRKDIDLGAVPAQENYVKTWVKVYNPSTAYKIRARLRPPSPNNLVVVGEEKSEIGEWNLEPREEKAIPVLLHLRTPGLTKAHILLENLSCQQEAIPISISAIRLDEFVNAIFPPGADETVTLPIATVIKDEDGCFRLESPVNSEIAIRNSGIRDLVISSTCADLPVTIGGVGNEKEKMDSSKATNTVELPSRQSTTVDWSLSDAPFFNSEQIFTLVEHEVVTIETFAHVFVEDVSASRGMNVLRAFNKAMHPVKGQCVLLVPVTASFALSEGCAEPQQINLGAVGVTDRSNKGRPNSNIISQDGVNTKIRLRNLSKYLPLRLRVESQPVVRFSSTRIEIAPGGSQVVDASLQLQLIPSQGPFHYQVFFINEQNPENDIEVTISGQYYRKVFNLVCNDNDVKESFSLPSLRIENVATPCILSEVKWNVSVTEDINLGLKVTKNREFEDLVDLQLLNYDATSSLEILSFSKEGGGNVGGGGGAGSGGAGVGDNNAGKRENASAGTGGGATSMGRRKDQRSSQQFRLRCVLCKNSSVARVTGIFFGVRKMLLESWSFETMSEVEKRFRSSTSNNIWIGTVTFSNPLTDDEEIEIFGALEPFMTFSVSSKFLVRPPRSSNLSSYCGEIVLTNAYEEYDADLSLRVLFGEHLSIPLRVELKTLTTSTPSATSSAATSATKELSLLETDSVVAVATPLAPPTVFVSSQEKLADGKATVHNVRVLAKSSVTVQVTIRCSSDPTVQIPQSLVEKFIGVVAMDSNAPFSVSTIRVGVAFTEESDDDGDDSDVEQVFDMTRKTIESDDSSFRAIAAVPAGETNTGSSHNVGASDSADKANSGSPEGNTSNCLAATIGSSGGISAVTETAPSSTKEHKGSIAKPEALSEPNCIRVLSLKNCTHVPNCDGAYYLNLSFPKDEAPQPEIVIRNNLHDRSVEYNVTVISQGPQPWLLLGSNSAVLEAGETQNLRLNVLSVEAGTFAGYLAITNTARPSETVYLRLSAEVFVPSTGEGLFDVIASSGQRVTSNTVRQVPMGHLYGSGSQRAHVALEIVNKGNTALEFPVSVVKPFRLELKPLQHMNPLYVGAVDNAGEVAPVDAEPALSAYTFDGKLIVCYIYGVPSAAGQKYVVVEPRSRVRLVFLFTCNELRVPRGYGLAVEADVVFRCKQTRDSHFTFKAKFGLLPSSFETQREYRLVTKGDEPCAETKVIVRNLLNVAQSFAFRSQSNVVYVIGGTGSAESDEVAFNAPNPESVGAVSSPASFLFPSFASIDVAANSEGYFLVRIDSRKAATILNYDKEEYPQLNEHAVILNATNPTERIRITFGVTSEDRTKIIKPVKLGRQLIEEHYLFTFAQRFSKILYENEEPITNLLKFYDAKQGGQSDTTSSSEDESDSDQEGNKGKLSGDVSFAKSNLSSANTEKNISNNGNNNNSNNTNNNNNNNRVIKDQKTNPKRHAREAPSRKPDWKSIHSLLLELIWVVDELVYYSILLCNSRRIDSYCSFIVATVANHPVMRLWWQYRESVPSLGDEGVFLRFVQCLDFLPCASPSLL